MQGKTFMVYPAIAETVYGYLWLSLLTGVLYTCIAKTLALADIS